MAEKDYPKFKKFERDGEKAKRLAKMRKLIKSKRRNAHMIRNQRPQVL